MLPPRPRRRRTFRLSLRALLALVALVAVGLGSWVAAAHAQRDAVAGLRAIDPDVTIDYDTPHRPGCDLPQPGSPGYVPPGDGRLRWWAPRWAYRWLGDHYFRTVTVALINPLDEDTPAHRAELVGHLARLRHLKVLAVEFAVDDADVARLAHLTGLKELTLGGISPGLTDRSLATLARLDHLETLYIFDAPITDVGVAELGRLPRLEVLTLIDPESGPDRPDFGASAGVLMTGRAPARPGRFPVLTDLRIRCRIPEGGGLALLGSMPAISTLHLEGPSIRDDDLRPVAALGRLGELSLRDSTIDGTGLRHLTGLDHLEKAYLSRSPLGDAALVPLAQLPALVELDLSETAVTAAGLEQLRSAPRLASLAVRPPVPGNPDRLAAILPRCDLHRSIEER